MMERLYYVRCNHCGNTCVATRKDLCDVPAAAAEPTWRLERYGPPLTVHDPRCWLDPRHLAKTPCSWPVT